MAPRRRHCGIGLCGPPLGWEVLKRFGAEEAAAPKFEGFGRGGGYLRLGPRGKFAEAFFEEFFDNELESCCGSAFLAALFQPQWTPLFQPLADGWAEDFVLHEVDQVGFDSPFDFVFQS